MSPCVGWDMGSGPSKGPGLASGALVTLEVPTHPGPAWGLGKRSRGQEPTFWQPWVGLVILIKKLGSKRLDGGISN